MILPFTTEKLRILATGQASEDSMSPPDVAPKKMTVHIFGDTSLMLRSRNGRSYNFTQVLGELEWSFHSVAYEDHGVDASQLLSIAKSIDNVAERFESGQCLDDHVCLFIWSGTDFSWESTARQDVLATQQDY